MIDPLIPILPIISGNMNLVEGIIRIYNAINKLKLKIKSGDFWFKAVFLLVLSLLIVSGLSYIININFFTGNRIDSDLHVGYLWSSSDNARYILSALSQAQAAIFGIFFTLIFIISQIQIQNKAASPILVRRWANSSELVFIFFIYVISISLDMILLRFVNFETTLRINVFYPLSLSVFAILILFFYLRKILLDLFDKSLVEEILSNSARYDLEGANLSGFDLSDVHLENRNLTNANLNKTNLSGAYLNKAKLINAKLTMCNLIEAKLNQTNLNNADLWGAKLNKSELKGAELENTRLWYSNLENADFTDSKLNNSLLVNTNLVGVDFSGADLDGAYFGGLNLVTESHKTKLGISRYDSKTIETLLKAKNINKAHFDDSMKTNLNNCAIELMNKPDIDPDFKASLEMFLASSP